MVSVTSQKVATTGSSISSPVQTTTTFLMVRVATTGALGHFDVRATEPAAQAPKSRQHRVIGGRLPEEQNARPRSAYGLLRRYLLATDRGIDASRADRHRRSLQGAAPPLHDPWLARRPWRVSPIWLDRANWPVCRTCGRSALQGAPEEILPWPHFRRPPGVKDGSDVRLYSRSGADYSNKLPRMRKASPNCRRTRQFSTASFA